MTEEVEQDEEVFYVNSSAPQLTQEGIESDISAPRQRQYEPFGPTRELESDPVLRPRIIFEELTRHKMRQNQQTRSANRVITFIGDHRGVSEPTYLPYSHTKVTWKGKEVMTSNQLERAREKKVGKLKTKIANGRSQI
uniref:Transposon MuDR mudrA n=1 Tax=Solanum tuberosum TaxID=4113 RepID=M1A2S8_SOLTU